MFRRCITVLPGLATCIVLSPVEKTIFRTLSYHFTLIFSLRVKKEYKTIYKKITQEPGGFTDERRDSHPLYGAVSLEFLVLDVDGASISLDPDMCTEVRGSALRKNFAAFFQHSRSEAAFVETQAFVFSRCLRKTKSIPYETRRAHLIEDHPDTL